MAHPRHAGSIVLALEEAEILLHRRHVQRQRADPVAGLVQRERLHHQRVALRLSQVAVRGRRLRRARGRAEDRAGGIIGWLR